MKMKTALALAALLVCALVPALAQKKKQDKDNTPERLIRAKYVIVAIQGEKGSLDFGESLDTPQEDRHARDAVEEALRKWDRYTVTLLPAQAELLFVVRAERSGSLYMRTGPPLVAKGKTTIGRIPNEPATSPASDRGLTLGTEIAPEADLVEVYAIDNGRQGMLLWRGLRKNGLSGAPPALIEEYQKKVDAAARKLGL